ncbi:MAG: hypothetical protein IM638_16320 [Bacteroidetes bacterium]|nr:hypothetical protein [Bacteroidota bacterium]
MVKTAFRICVLLALVVITGAGRCRGGKGNNDLLVRLYSRAYVEPQPLRQPAEPVYEPLLGNWNLMNDRPLRISRSTSNTYEMRFVSPYLSERDVVYEAHITTLGGVRYLNMKSYMDNYMFFRVPAIQHPEAVLYMLAEAAAEYKGEMPLTTFLQNNARGIDTASYWEKLVMRRITAGGADSMQRELHRSEVNSIRYYTLFAERYPADAGLMKLKKEVARKEIAEATTFKDLVAVAEFDAAFADSVRTLARRRCTSVNWCIDYISYYKNSPDQAAIADTAFLLQKTTEEGLRLLEFFPQHPKAARAAFIIADAELAAQPEPGEVDDFELLYARTPAVLSAGRRIVLTEWLTLDSTCFFASSHLLTSAGKLQLDKLLAYISPASGSQPESNDLFAILYAPDHIAGRTQYTSLHLAANRCKAVNDYLAPKLPAGMKIHFIPGIHDSGGENGITQNQRDYGRFTIRSKTAEPWRAGFFKYTINNSGAQAVPNGERDYPAAKLIRLPEIEQQILQEFTAEAARYRSKQPYRKVIPPNYWKPEYATEQPGFAEFQQQLKAAAKKAKVKKKRVVLFCVEE